MSRRWRFYASLAVLVLATLACFAGANGEWSDRTAMVGNNPAEANEQAYYTLELLAIAAVNAIATLVFVLGRFSPTWWVVLAAQIGIFAFAMLQISADGGDVLGWFEFSFLPLTTAVFLILIRVVQVSSVESQPGRSLSASS